MIASARLRRHCDTPRACWEREGVCCRRVGTLRRLKQHFRGRSIRRRTTNQQVAHNGPTGRLNQQRPARTIAGYCAFLRRSCLRLQAGGTIHDTAHGRKNPFHRSVARAAGSPSRREAPGQGQVSVSRSDGRPAAGRNGRRTPDVGKAHARLHPAHPRPRPGGCRCGQRGRQLHHRVESGCDRHRQADG